MPTQPITPSERHPDLAKAIGLADIYLKREDLHPYGSHKGRSIPVMIDHYRNKGDRNFAISSSGNAALAAALHIKKLNENASASDKITIDIFVGNNISPNKLAKLQSLTDEQIRVLVKERPLQALSSAISEGKRSLRQSTDDIALLGYESLAEELSEIDELGSVFIGTSSGTTAEALARYFTTHKSNVQIHIVQTSSCHHLSEVFEAYGGPDERSIADAIVDQTAIRKDVLVPMIHKTGGYGWCATNEEIITAQTLVKKHADLDISTNSALSIVGAMQAIYRTWDFKGKVVCIIAGQ
ncbi:MAG: PLP-dependent lyase/thiolase [Candidatus Paceibacterota bacterium]